MNTENEKAVRDHMRETFEARFPQHETVLFSEIYNRYYTEDGSKETSVWMSNARWEGYQAALQSQSNTPQDGWVMVPVEPTQAMCDAAMVESRDWQNSGDPWHAMMWFRIYRRMLAAAPKAPQKVSNTPQDGMHVVCDDSDGLVAYSNVVAGQLLCIRDLLEKKDVDGALFALLHLSDPYLSKADGHEWSRMEEIAKSTPPQQQESADMQEIVDAYKHLHKGKFGMHWLWAAILRINAGESEQSVMNDFGYVFDIDAALQSQSPEEWKLVPVEPTIAMVEAAELDSCGKLLADDIADAYSAMLSAAPTPPQHQESGEADEPLSEWLATEISAIDCEYRGDPSYTHDAYWMREAVLGFIEKYKSVIDTYSTPSTPSESQAGTTQEAVAWVELSDSEIEEGRNQVFSTSNPYCPCDAKTMRKAVRWAETTIKAKNHLAVLSAPSEAVARFIGTKWDWVSDGAGNWISQGSLESQIPLDENTKLYLAPPTSTAIAAMGIKQAAGVIWKHLAEVKSRGAVFGGTGNARESLEIVLEQILALTPAIAEAELEALMMMVADKSFALGFSMRGGYLPDSFENDLRAIVRRVLEEKGE